MALRSRVEKLGLILFRRRCPGCGAPMPAGSGILCCWCALRVFQDGCRTVGGLQVLTAFTHSGIPRELVIRLKYNGERHLADTLARLALLGWSASPDSRDILVPVPASPGRIRERGYNQAALLTRSMAKRTGARTADLLGRRSRGSQVGRTAGQRRMNVKGVFYLKKTVPSSGRIWLIDDVMTTGSTLLEAFEMLRKGGAKSVTTAVVCFRNTCDESMIHPKEVSHEGVR